MAGKDREYGKKDHRIREYAKRKRKGLGVR